MLPLIVSVPPPKAKVLYTKKWKSIKTTWEKLSKVLMSSPVPSKIKGLHALLPVQLISTGSREHKNIEFRSMLVLDYDHLDVDLVEDICSYWNNWENVTATGHSHSLDNGSLHIYLPLQAPIYGAEIWREAYEHLIRESIQLGLPTPDPSMAKIGQVCFFGSVIPGNEEYFWSKFNQGPLLCPKSAIEVAKQTIASNIANKSKRQILTRPSSHKAPKNIKEGYDYPDELSGHRRYDILTGHLSYAEAVVGGVVTLRKMQCPSCEKDSVWIAPFKSNKIRCDHVNTCSYGHKTTVYVSEYIETMGLLDVALSNVREENNDCNNDIPVSTEGSDQGLQKVS